jgi:hypothetical protein
MEGRPRCIASVQPGLEYIELPTRESGQRATKTYRGLERHGGIRAHSPVVSAVYAGG